MKEVRKRLADYGKKRIDRSELLMRLGLSGAETEACFAEIGELEKQGILEPVKRSGTNGNLQFPLYNRYRIHLEEEVSEEERKEIERLHPMLLRGGYLVQHPAEYGTFRQELNDLSSYLFSMTSRERAPVSRKERSFLIFGKEKMLDDSSFQGILRKIGFSKEELCFYDTPEYCFHDFILNRPEDREMRLLVCENKDIWFDIRRRMFEQRHGQVFGVPFDGVVYGNGNTIAENKEGRGALTEYLRFLGQPKASILYWGDIDREGFDIYLRTVKYNPEVDLHLFTKGYCRMLDALPEGTETEKGETLLRVKKENSIKEESGIKKETDLREGNDIKRENSIKEENDIKKENGLKEENNIKKEIDIKEEKSIDRGKCERITEADRKRHPGWEESKDHRPHDLGAYEEIYALFEEPYTSLLREIINGNYLIPQEIINYQTLLSDTD